MKHKAVGFDYGGVLNGTTGRVFSAAAIDVLGVTRDEFREAYFRHNSKINRDEVTWPELWEIVLTDLGKADKLTQLLALDDNRGGDALNGDVVELAKRLKQNGYVVGILSNNQAVALERMKLQRLDEIFGIIHISAITGFVKPQPEAFMNFAKDMKVRVEDMVFIDDSNNSLSTAAEVGYTPVLYQDCNQLKDNLASLGILVG